MKQFQIITEADARTLEPGTTVELAPGGHVTPLARDTLRARGIAVLDAGRALDATEDLLLAPHIRTIAMASDHTGIKLRRHLAGHLRSRGLAVHDLGTDSADPVDYPDIAGAVAKAVAGREADAGIVIDGAGIGSAIAANKVKGIRAAMCPDETIARYSREHNGANILTLGASLVDLEQARRIVEAWLGASIREPRYVRRLMKIRRLESGG